MAETISKTFRNLQSLEEARTMARLLCKGDYSETVKPFISIIEKVAEANNENHFEAMKRIQDLTDLVSSDEKRILFAAALMEIVEDKKLKF